MTALLLCGISLTLESIEALATDQASPTAARKLLKPSSWPTLAEGDGLVGVQCRDSGATPSTSRRSNHRIWLAPPVRLSKKHRREVDNLIQQETCRAWARK